MILEGLLILAAVNMAKKKDIGATWSLWDVDFKREAAKYPGQDWRWLKAIALNESTLGLESSVALGLREPNNIEGSKSQDGKSWGLMQVTLTTARDLDASASEAKLNNPQYSIALAARYLPRIERMLAPAITRAHPRFLEFLIKSYNQGAGNSLKEYRGQSSGFAKEYWERFQRNLARVG